MEEKTPAQQLLDAITALENTEDPENRAMRGHALQEVMRASTARVREITDGAVRELRDAGSPLAELSKRLGVSMARVSQMAAGQRTSRPRPTPPVIYAFRMTDGDDQQWYGDAEAVPAGEFEVGYIDFQPAVRNRFAGHRLQVRFGPVADDGLRPEMHAYTTVNGRRLRVTAGLQDFLFAPDDTV
jgi:hypothetical protein